MRQREFNKKKFKLIYIVLLVVAFTTKYADYKTTNAFQLMISSIIIMLSLFLSLFSKEKNDIYSFLFKIFMIPALVIHLYSIMLIVTNNIPSSYFVSNLSKYIPIILAICIIKTFRSDSYEICLKSLIISWLVSISFALLLRGIGVIPYSLVSGFTSNRSAILGVSKNYLELHDLVLSMGLAVIYYFWCKEELTKRDLLRIIIIFIIMILGIKRIAALGVFISLLAIRKLKKTKKKEKIIKALGVLLIIVLFAYLTIVFSPELYGSLANKFNLNLMGRNYYYEIIIKYGNLSVDFIGIGRNGVSKVLLDNYSFLKVSGVHNDILKMYIENGFIVFTLWLWFSLIKIPKIIQKKFDVESSMLYIVLMIYTMIVYMTDNVENYLIFQVLTIVIIGDYLLKKKKMKGDIYD